MEILKKIKSVKLCLMAHPDNEIDSEFADRISDLEEIENQLQKDTWIKIESEKDLPKDTVIDVIIDSKPYQGFIYEARCGLLCCVENRYNQKELSEIIEVSFVTHFQQIVTPDLPTI